MAHLLAWHHVQLSRDNQTRPKLLRSNRIWRRTAAVGSRRCSTLAAGNTPTQEPLTLSQAGQATSSAQPPAQPLPQTYKRLIARRTGESFRQVAEVEEAPLPQPGEGEVLIKVMYAGVNGGCETFRARGEYAFARNKQLPWFALGAEGAGQVVALGPGVAPTSALDIGRHVTFVGGAFAEYVVAKAAMCWPVEEASPQAVALTISGTVAATALLAVGALKQGETLLVTAAAGATGHFAAQLGLQEGCRVIATCGGRAKAARLAALGVERIIDHTQEDIGEVLRREYPGGVDMAYEGVGGALQRTVFSSLAPGGRQLQVGYISEYPHTYGSSGGNDGSSSSSGGSKQGQEAGLGQQHGGQADEAATAAAAEAPGLQLPPCSELFWKGLKVEHEGRTLFGQVWPQDRADTLRCKARVFDLYSRGELQAWVDESARFEGVESIPDAVDHMLSGQCIGKVVVKL